MLTVPDAKAQTELSIFESIPFSEKIIIICNMKISLLRMS